MKQKKYLLGASIIIVFATVIGLIAGCKKKIDDGFNLTINTDVIKSFAVIKFEDEANSGIIPTGVSVEIVGNDAQHIYNNVGKKDFVISGDGVLELVVDPARIPTTTNPVTFYVKAYGVNYLPITTPVFITSINDIPKVVLKLTNLSKPKDGTKIAQATLNLVNGEIRNPSIVKVFKSGRASSEVLHFTQSNINLLGGGASGQDSTYFDDGTTTVYLPIGTKFYGYKMKTVTIPARKDSSLVAKKVLDSSKTINGTLNEYFSIKYSYDVYTVQESEYSYQEWDSVASTASTVKVVLKYETSGSSYNYTVNWNSNNASSNYTLSNGDISKQDELLYSSAAKLKVTDLYFVDEKGQEIRPDKSSKWFTSMVLNEQFIHPTTKKQIAENDSLDIGLDDLSKKTNRVAVKKATNGQLRLESQAYECGIYYKAPFVQSFSRAVDTYVGASDIPDPENLNGGFALQIDNNQLYYEMDANTGTRFYAAKVCSTRPIVVSSSVFATYVNKLIKSSSFDMNIFKPPYMSELPPTVTFDVTATCTKTNKSIKPTLHQNIGTTINGSNVKYFIYITNGIFQTRFFEQKKEYEVSGWVGNVKLTNKGKVEGMDVKVDINSDGQQFCNSIP